MMPVSNNNYQDCTTIIYQLDEVKKTFRQYRKQNIQPIGKDDFLPELLRIEKNNGYNTYSGLNNFLRLRDASNWSICTKLGLKPTGISPFYCTDVFVENKKVLCIVCYPKESLTIELSIFPGFYPCEQSKRMEKAKEMVHSIIHKKEYKKFISSNLAKM
ncbi:MULTISPECIES: hypothetical protein [Chryseobacterium]|uniref:Uncharacterized protein n=1 Tax=Chryseobacterium geocarposphaerae TaxID=1416776 RepID=A0ABU1LGM4_9FLAO|nr:MULTISPECIES: hypothetical protein [Chryseobacterium]MDR6405883.1 hypothetical protein [Chryseobacterium geocarposphaerae]MDR6698953.1 hypothetical protein [Chryseobacterium ginsenosidimutans]